MARVGEGPAAVEAAGPCLRPLPRSSVGGGGPAGLLWVGRIPPTERPWGIRARAYAVACAFRWWPHGLGPGLPGDAAPVAAAGRPEPPPAAVWAEELADRTARRRIRRCRLWPSEAAPLLAWTAEVLRSGRLQPLPADLMPLLKPSRSPFRTPEAGLAWAVRHLGGSARIWREGEELWLLPEGLLPPGWDPDPEAVRPEAERLWADLFGGR
jgi:hypothetical protein